jgi:hypothetical protein
MGAPPGGGWATLAREDWGVPAMWRLLVTLPLAGGAQLVRFLDWLLFGFSARVEEHADTQSPPQASDRPEWFGAAVLVISAIVVLLLGRR